MTDIRKILEEHWGHKHFRPLQEEIIESVLTGNDTLALLPTGGGKSICFQVPGMAMPGICIVVSPLIALMKDQVANLRKKGINAMAITSAMHKREIDIALDNCVHGNVKFLYLSPERLETEIVQARLKRMKVNLLAIDESHCISQWGYDFRPSYLKIAQIREILPDVPVLALTATATKEVVKDIQLKLNFKKQNVFKKSFERKNLTYVVLQEEDKLQRLLKILTNVKGSSVVYVRNRKKTQEIAAFLQKNQISADYYHAGLEGKIRDEKQQDWITNKKRVIVCTNAFGMGIDKPDVRSVVHVDLPDSLEAYFQEAGRAGRDEQAAYAILLYNNSDKVDLERNVLTSFPEPEEIRKTYQALANYYQIPTGSGQNVCYPFNISEFCDNYKMKPVTVFNCLNFIEREGYISLTDNTFEPSKIRFEMNREDLYKFQISNQAFDPFIKFLLRSYSSLFDTYVKISEFEISRKLQISQNEVSKKLDYLDKLKLLHYLPYSALPTIEFLRPRVDVKDLTLSKENYSMLMQRANVRMERVINYATAENKCRSQILLSYFGDDDSYPCKQCDICLEERKRILHSNEFELVYDQVKQLLVLKPMTLHELVSAIIGFSEEKILHSIQWLIDNEKLLLTEDSMLILSKKPNQLSSNEA